MINIAERIGSIAATLTVPLAFLVGIIFVLRIVGRKKDKDHAANRLNRKLRSAHIPMGIALIVLSAIHGICSDFVIWGAVCFASLVLLTLAYLLRRLIANWMMWHRLLSVVFYITLIIHLIEVSGMR